MTPDHQDDQHARDTHEHEREVIVTNGNGSNLAGIVVAVLAIIVFGILGYLFIGAMGDDGGDGGGAMPDEVDVNVDPGGDSGG